MIKREYKKYFLFLLNIFLLNISFCYAATYDAKVNGSGVNMRKGPGTNYETIKSVANGSVYSLADQNIISSEKGCAKGWYKVYYETNTAGYICGEFIVLQERVEGATSDPYDRPWTSPKKSIIGGAKYISAKYIKMGQFTSYLKKFNVNPNGNYKVYNHQYMENLAAPYSEAYSSFKSYRDNNLLSLPLEFTIPIYSNMGEAYPLPGKELNTDCQSEVTDTEFEALLDNEGFPESYKCKLRLIHNTYPNWIFHALDTGLEFSASVDAEKKLSSIQGGDIYYDMSSGDKVSTEKGWYVANRETVSYYLDPRNFLYPERILMFEDLGYSENYTSTVIQSILNGTFMEGYSLVDNELYCDIFLEAGKEADMSSVYLASLARQESGTKGNGATSGEEFTYQGVTYKNLYNFYNIGASSSASSPLHAGLVWANNGNTQNIVSVVNNDATIEQENISLDSIIIEKLGAKIENNCLTNIEMGTTLGKVKELLSGINISVEGINDEDILRTGLELVISDGTSSLNYVISVKGDVDGDGALSASDYVKIKNYIMEKSDSELNAAQSVAADIDESGDIGASDYVKIKNTIMER